MGILNLTTDSFFDGGQYLTEQNILKRTEQMLAEGADIIDLGACSTRPNAQEVPLEFEIQTITKAITLINQHFKDVIISVDTFRYQVAQKALDLGAAMINDISGGTFDNEAIFQLLANYQVPYDLMHIQGKPADMQKNPHYQNVVTDVAYYFSKKLNRLHQLGLNDIVLDPGFGFGKTIEHNYTLLKNLSHFQRLFHKPLLVGISRKSMIYKLLETDANNALNGTTVLNTLAILNGANILRVHDIKAAKELITLMQTYIKS